MAIRDPPSRSAPPIYEKPTHPNRHAPFSTGQNVSILDIPSPGQDRRGPATDVHAGRQVVWQVAGAGGVIGIIFSQRTSFP